MSDILSTTPTFVSEIPTLTFGWIDYSLFGGLLGMSLLIGIYFGFFSKQDSANEYLFGGKTMSYVPVATSILASYLSGITFLGIPTEVYFHGAQYVLSVFPAISCCLLTAFMFIPIFYNLQVSSSYEYLELRFSKTIRTLASFLYILSLILYIPIVIYVPSLAFSQVSGYSVHTISPIFSLVCITYTTMGGVKAVVWTDTFQFIFTIGGLVSVLALGLKSIGGFSEMWIIADEGRRLDIFDMDPSPFKRNTFWGMTIGMFFGNVSRFAIAQKFIQRFLAIEKKSDIKKAMYLLIGGLVSIMICCVLAGLIVYAKYHDCDPLSAKSVRRNDQTLPYFVMDVAGYIHGLPGIFLAGLVSSALSTMSASVNTLSGIIYKDFVDQWIPESINKDAKSATIMKFITVIIGVITIALVFVIERLGTIFEMAISLGSIVDGPLLGLFLLGMMVPWTGKKGALTGACGSVAIMSVIVVGIQWNTFNGHIRHPNLPTSVENCPYPLNETLQSRTDAPTLATNDEPMLLFRISMMFLVLVGTVLTIIIALITSLAYGEAADVSKVDPQHLTPFVRRFLPEKRYTEVPLKKVTKN